MADAFLGVRKDYERATLEFGDLDPDPCRMLERWLQEARQAEHPEPTAMSLATVNQEGLPSVRVVLLRGLDHGLRFFTNYESQKGSDLSANPRAAVCFWWAELERQARFEGFVERLTAEESDAYFAARPYDSQIASASSPQSRVIEGRDVLEAAERELRERYPTQVPRPAHWGGYRLLPERAEFWQGRKARSHDRFLYRRQSDGTWQIDRLAP